ncbi:uncharacterized protein LOC133523247 [Cydia pomonella]|uniref:uncharacterized protein LOC133523247 n=1 Tax=Cydia pomonella TaxID=82600 RepID=UPI002ADDEF4D|nr:uncharacterized protein LOC133523247 [Cydia pomonella]
MCAGTMKRGARIAVFLISLYFTGTLEQTIYNANNFYQPMTEDYDVRHNGQLFMPPCMKQLLNCWELVKPELFCTYTRQYRQALESICMDLRFHCNEFTGPNQFTTLNISTWIHCPPTRLQLSTVDLRPYSGLIPHSDESWWRNLQYIPNIKDYDLINVKG